MMSFQNNTKPVTKSNRVWVFFGTIIFGLYSLLVVAKPIHIDETNFFMMTRGSVWSPHEILINWQGTTQPAFDVLSNPPGIVWVLYPFQESPLPVIRLWMISWSILTLWSFWELGKTTKHETTTRKTWALF